MGLQPLAPDAWIDSDEDLAADLVEKDRLIADRRETVYGSLEGQEPAGAELRDLLAEHLPRRFPDRYRREGGAMIVAGRCVALDETPALLTAARLVQEDLCLLQPSPAGPVLSAAALCFPAFWRLAEKLGRPLLAVHEPVPGYADQLSVAVDRFIARLSPDRPMWRLNWSLPTEAGLFQPGPHPPPDPPVSVRDAGRRVTLRIERQTFRKLPRSGAVLFTIRTYRDPLDALAQRPALAAGLAGAVRALTPEMARYKGVTPFREVLLTYLDRLAAAPA